MTGLEVFTLPEVPTCPSVDLSSARLPPFSHQAAATAFVYHHVYSLNASEMGTGKTKILIDAACALYRDGVIDRVIVITPAGIRQVWAHPELGELKKHLWDGLPVRVTEYHSKLKQWKQSWPENNEGLSWIVTNYEYVIERMIKGEVTASSRERIETLLRYCGPKTLLVLDESSAIKNPSAEQTKSCMKFRKRCGRVHLMNGTPVSEGAGDLFSQGNILHPSILDCPSKTQFRARYAIEEPVRGAGGLPLLTKWGTPVKTVKSWKNLNDLERRFAPYVIRYMKADCLDLPEKLPTVPLFVPLSTSWATYKEMRDEAMVWLTENEASTSPQITTKIMRLSQITSGFLGGVAENDILEREATGPVDFDPEVRVPDKYEKTVGSEKLDFFLDWLAQRVEEDPHFKLLVWSVHRNEIIRVVDTLKLHYQHVGIIIGGQKLDERAIAVQLLDPRTAPEGPAIVVGSPYAGGKGLTLTAAHTVVYLSNGYSLGARLQSEDRVHRAGQRNVVSYFDLVATGPQGQKTVDLAVIQALQRKDDLSTATTSAWLSALREES